MILTNFITKHLFLQLLLFNFQTLHPSFNTYYKEVIPSKRIRSQLSCCQMHHHLGLAAIAANLKHS